MHSTVTAVAGALVIEPLLHADARGSVFETYQQQRFDQLLGSPIRFAQDTQSRSVRGVLRGLHYQLPPHAQGKLVRVVRGTVFDVAVDLRRRSATFGRWVGVELSEDNHRQIWLPPGLAHGFLVLSDVADVLYKTTAYYTPQSERSIRWDDPAIGIDWPRLGQDPLLSPRDAAAPMLADAELPG